MNARVNLVIANEQIDCLFLQRFFDSFFSSYACSHSTIISKVVHEFKAFLSLLIGKFIYSSYSKECYKWCDSDGCFNLSKRIAQTAAVTVTLIAMLMALFEVLCLVKGQCTESKYSIQQMMLRQHIFEKLSVYWRAKMTSYAKPLITSPIRRCVSWTIEPGRPDQWISFPTSSDVTTDESTTEVNFCCRRVVVVAVDVIFFFVFSRFLAIQNCHQRVNMQSNKISAFS